MAQKILMLVEASIKETASIIYPYKGFGRSFRKYRGELSKTIFDLKEHGYLEEVEIEGDRYLKITPKGRLKALKRSIFKEWDGWWRIIAFDIEEKRKKTRNVFREHLYSLECTPLQKSVWITPHDISYEIEQIAEILNIEENVDYFLAKAISNEDKYLQMFNLKKSSN